MKVEDFLYQLNPWIPVEVGLLGADGKRMMHMFRFREVVDKYGWDVAAQNPEINRLIVSTEGQTPLTLEESDVEAEVEGDRGSEEEDGAEAPAVSDAQGDAPDAVEEGKA